MSTFQSIQKSIAPELEIGTAGTAAEHRGRPGGDGGCRPEAGRHGTA